MSFHLEAGKWLLERQLAWISAAEVKVGVLVPLNIAMLGGLAAAYEDSGGRTGWAVFVALLSGVLSVVAVFCAAMGVIPRTRGPLASLIFFGRVAELTGDDYSDALKALTPDRFIEDLARQIQRNAEIARDKFKWVTRSMYWSIAAAAVWLLAIGLLVRG